MAFEFLAVDHEAAIQVDSHPPLVVHPVTERTADQGAEVEPLLVVRFELQEAADLPAAGQAIRIVSGQRGTSQSVR